MEEPVKRSDILEREYTQSLILGGVGLVSLLLMALFLNYGGMLYSLSWLFLLAWLGTWGYAGWRLYQTRSVSAHPITCPFCNQDTVFITPPSSDFTCEHCMKRVPMENGRILEIVAVKCPHCGSVQQLSSRATVAICEQCNHEIMVGRMKRANVAETPFGPPAEEDSTRYDLYLISAGRDPEPVIHELQSLLTLNRPDVKKLLESLPMVLLTSLTKRKGEALQRKLTELGAKAELKQVDDPNRVPTPWG
jgi:ribosomal protein L7/L12